MPGGQFYLVGKQPTWRLASQWQIFLFKSYIEYPYLRGDNLTRSYNCLPFVTHGFILVFLCGLCDTSCQFSVLYVLFCSAYPVSYVSNAADVSGFHAWLTLRYFLTLFYIVIDTLLVGRGKSIQHTIAAIMASQSHRLSRIYITSDRI